MEPERVITGPSLLKALNALLCQTPPKRIGISGAALPRAPLAKVCLLVPRSLFLSLAWASLSGPPLLGFHWE
jgi:hypothetical protein